MSDIQNKIEVLSDLDNAILLLLRFAKSKHISYLNDAQVNKAIYNLQVKSLEFVGKKFCDVRYHRADRGPISNGVKESLVKLNRLGFIESKYTEVGENMFAHQHSPRVDDFENVIDINRVMFAVSTFQLLEKKYPKFRNDKGQPTTLGSYDTEPMKAITSQEESLGKKTIGIPIDFHKVSLNAHVLDII